MKKLLAKIRNKRLKGNISLLVILILLASSVISLLSINQIQRLMTYGNMTFNYFRAFYIAKAWTELALTEVYYREAWFEHTVNSWDDVVTENLVWIYSGFNPYFTMAISWNFRYLTNDVRYTNECTGEYKIVLGTWEWVMLSLFRDRTSNIGNILTWTIEDSIRELEGSNIKNLRMSDLVRKGDWPNKYFTFWLFDYNSTWDMENIFVETWNDNSRFSTFLNNIDNMGWNRKYLTIKNSWTWDEVAEFCIFMNNNGLIPYSDSLVTVQANYGDMEVGLQSVIKKWVPDWTLNVLWNQPGSS